jgi:hypothetical protein
MPTLAIFQLYLGVYIRGVASLEEDHLVIFYYFNASEIYPDKGYHIAFQPLVGVALSKGDNWLDRNLFNCFITH